MTKKSTLKALALAISALLILGVCPVVNAASVSLDSAVYNAASKSITIQGSAADFSGSLTLLVYNKSDLDGGQAATIFSEDILYIDQYDGSTSGNFSREVFLRDDVTYADEVTVAVGGTGISNAARRVVQIDGGGGETEDVEVTVGLNIPAAAQADASVKLVPAEGDEIELTAGAGGFTAFVPVGEYTLVIERPGYLTRSKAITVDENGKAISNVTLYAGDIDGNGSINAFDLSDFGMAYGKTRTANPDEYSVACDFDGDGSVNAFDLSDLGIGYGKTAAAYDSLTDIN